MQRSNSPRKRISLSGEKTRCSSRTGSETSTGSRFLRFKLQPFDQCIIYDPAAFGPIWECSGVKSFHCPGNGLMNCRCININVAFEVLPTSRRRMCILILNFMLFFLSGGNQNYGHGNSSLCGGKAFSFMAYVYFCFSHSSLIWSFIFSHSLFKTSSISFSN